MAKPNAFYPMDDADALSRLREAVPSRFRAEIIGGALHITPRPYNGHQYTNAAVTSFVAGPHMFEDDGSKERWWVVTSPDVRLRQDATFSPDVAAWRKSTFSVLPSVLTVVPEWVCEILSPATGSYDRDTKMPFYARIGVEWLWIIDTETHSVEVYQLREGSYARVAAPKSGTARLQPFDIDLPVDRFWLPEPG